MTAASGSPASTTGRSYVVATAGHVDHGKSALVRALTGIEPDRWDEERRRGMTIGLGFAWTRLPGGGNVAFVDVPGHERFLTTMLAGVGSVPAVLLVIAADEGWSAQTEEHVAALDALGIRHLLVAVTKCDLADAEPVGTDAVRRLTATTLGRGGPLDWVGVSAHTGEGMAALRAGLERLLARLPDPDPAAPVRLWVDRAFTIKGAGTVVTGTLGAGRLEVGAGLDVVPLGRQVTVRGLQSEQCAVPAVEPVRRTAVNLRGIDHTAVHRGDALVEPGRFTVTCEVDVVTVAAGDTETAAAFESGGETVVHVGAAAVPARVRSLGPLAARLRLARPLPLHVGDRLLLRRAGRDQAIVAVDVADVVPPPLRRRGAARGRGELLGRPPPGGWAGAAAAAAHVVSRGAVSERQLSARGYRSDPASAAPPAGCHRLGGWWCSAAQLTAWRDAALADVAGSPHGELPLETLRHRLDLPTADVLAAVLAGADRLRVDGDVVRDTARTEPVESPGLAALRGRLRSNPFDAPDASELAALEIPSRELSRAVAAGEIVALGHGVYVAPTALGLAEQRLGGLSQPFTVAQAREALGLSRRVAVPLLEELDRRRITRRLDQTLRAMRFADPA